MMTSVNKIMRLVYVQFKEIQECEANGRSYAGPNGLEIRKADQKELARLIEELEECRKRNFPGGTVF